jgi:thiamine pyrophosphate-dependent acetolactate synthase large subunit-like protein
MVRGYLQSKDAIDRQTGAIVAGQENQVATKPLLRALLEDDEFVIVGSGRHTVWYRQYYVRKAAVEALKALDEHHPDIQTSIKDPDLNKPP